MQNQQNCSKVQNVVLAFTVPGTPIISHPSLRRVSGAVKAEMKTYVQITILRQKIAERDKLFFTRAKYIFSAWSATF